MTFYRIKQIAPDKFIPQVKIGIFNFWHGINMDGTDVWNSDEYMNKWCCVDTLQKAKDANIRFKSIQELKKEYPKYHKL